ncbi:MAG: GFA family protein, partial [Phenylobacterium sp.]|nr:GFA family protein [Phenylobacterium sp.]
LDEVVDMDLTAFDGRNWEANAAGLAHLSREAAP